MQPNRHPTEKPEDINRVAKMQKNARRKYEPSTLPFYRPRQSAIDANNKLLPLTKKACAGRTQREKSTRWFKMAFDFDAWVTSCFQFQQQSIHLGENISLASVFPATVLPVRPSSSNSMDLRVALRKFLWTYGRP